MRKVAAILALVSLSIFAWTQEKVEDFRGIDWGTARSAFDFEENLISKGATESSTYYERDGEDLTIGTAMLENIFYVFDDRERFYKVVLNGTSQYNEDMEYILLQRFGKPDKRFRKNAKFVRMWNIGKVNIICNYSGSQIHDFG